MEERHLDFGCLAGDPDCRAERRCGACARYAHALAALRPTGDEPTLPSSLRARLLGIAGDDQSGGAAGHLYQRVLAAVAAAKDDAGELEQREPLRPLPADLEGPSRVAYRALRTTLAEARARVELPPVLKARLRAIARPATPPWWIRDGRVAAAACLLLTVISTTFVGDASASLGPNSQLAAQRREWTTLGRERAAGYAADLQSRLVETWQGGVEWVSRHTEELRDRAEDHVREFQPVFGPNQQIRNTELGRRWVGPASQGADHESPKS